MTVGCGPVGEADRETGERAQQDRARTKLKELVRDHDDGLAVAPHGYTVADAVNDWLDYGLTGRDPSTVENRRILARHHVIPALGGRKLRELPAEDVDRWLTAKSGVLSTSTLQRIKSILARSISRAQARDKVKRNVMLLCETPTGQAGRPSKALSLDQAQALLDATPGSTMGAYVVVSLLTGARTEELRPLTWSHVDLEGNPSAAPPVLPHMMVWRSVRLAAIPRPGRHAALSHCRNGASTRSRSTATGSGPRARSRGSGGPTTISCSPPRSARS